MYYGQIKVAGDVDALVKQLPEKEHAGLWRGAKKGVGGAVKGGVIGALGGTAVFPGLGTAIGAAGGAALGGVMGAGKGLLTNENKYDYVRRVARQDPKLLAHILSTLKK